MAGRSSQPQVARMQLAQILAALRDDDQPGFALAELNDLLSSLTAGELCSAVEHADLAGLTPYLPDYVAGKGGGAAPPPGGAPPPPRGGRAPPRGGAPLPPPPPGPPRDHPAAGGRGVSP